MSEVKKDGDDNNLGKLIVYITSCDSLIVVGRILAFAQLFLPSVFIFVH